jgi:hypothetical protein
MRINHWHIVREEDSIRLSGTIEGHPDLPDGEPFTTGRIHTLSVLSSCVIDIGGDEYQLGEPEEGIEASAIDNMLISAMLS